MFTNMKFEEVISSGVNFLFTFLTLKFFMYVRSPISPSILQCPADFTAISCLKRYTMVVIPLPPNQDLMRGFNGY